LGLNLKSLVQSCPSYFITIRTNRP